MTNSLTSRPNPTIGAHHLGGVRTVMMVARHQESRSLITVPLRLVEQRIDDVWTFEVGSESWEELIDVELDSVCLVAQVDDRFVTIDANVKSFERGSHLEILPRRQTFWDVPTGRVFRVASGPDRPAVSLPASPDVLLGDS